MSRSKYIILHIPKNGGTSLIEILSSQFYNWQIYAIPDYKRSEFVLKLKNLNSVRKHFIKLVMGGHFEYGVHKFFSNYYSVQYFAMLRDPIARTVSFYEYARRTPAHYLYKTLNDEQLSLSQFLERDDLNMEVRNGQTKIIAGIDQKNLCLEYHFHKAIEHIENSFFLVGVLELFDETLFELSKRMKLKKPLFVKKLNTSDKQLEKIDSAVNRKIIELNAFDLKLYSRFRSKFESEFDSIGNPEYEKFKNSLRNLGESKS